MVTPLSCQKATKKGRSFPLERVSGRWTGLARRGKGRQAAGEKERRGRWAAGGERGGGPEKREGSRGWLLVRG
jgi:hypothetical protein